MRSLHRRRRILRVEIYHVHVLEEQIDVPFSGTTACARRCGGARARHLQKRPVDVGRVIAELTNLLGYLDAPRTSSL